MTYAEEILKGLTEVPCPQYPGEIIVRGQAEPILISPLKKNILIAACQVNESKGRIIAAAHSIFLDYLFENSEDEREKRQLGCNLLKWLTKADSEQNGLDKVVEIDKIDDDLLCYKHFKLITWDYKIRVNEAIIKRIKLYLDDGGALFCVATPWSFLQQNPNKKLTDIQLYNFLLEFDIEFTSKCKHTPSRIELNRKLDLEDSVLIESLHEINMSDFGSQNYNKEILHDLTQVSVPKYPGNIALSGNSQAILTCASDCTRVIIAACKYGKGRVLVTSHSYFFDHVDAEETDRILLAKNMFKWIHPGSKIHDITLVPVEKFTKQASTDNKVVLRWDDHVNVSSKQEELILSFISNGGALIGVSCPWSWLHKNPGRTLSDMGLASFLKNFGIYYTSQCLTLEHAIQVTDNKAEFANFDKALEEIKGNVDHKDFEDYISTLAFGFTAFDSNVLRIQKLTDYQVCIQRKCNKFPDNNVPSASNPIRDEAIKKEIRVLSRCFENANVIAPGICEFPGSYENQPKPRLLTGIICSVETQVAQWCSTGYYLPAGVRCRIEFVAEKSSDIADWSVRIGSHTDDLSGRESLTRWPSISVVKRMQPELVVFSAYGGLLYFEAMKTGPCRIQTVLNNVVEAPYYDLLIPETLNQWKIRRNSIGLWTELAGKYIVFTVPSRTISGLEDPRKLLEFWDKVYEETLLLSGRSIEQNRRRRERFVCDQQLNAGLDKSPHMHAGYPIVGHMDCCSLVSDHFVLNVNMLKKQGHWPLFSEIGYNMMTDVWAFEGAADVFPNLSTLHVFHTVLGTKITDSDWLRLYEKEINGYFQQAGELTYDDWARSYQAVKVYMFALLVRYFGWETFYDLTAESEVDSAGCFGSNQERLDHWVLKYSRLVGYNIKPHFQNFGLPVSDEVSEQLSDLEPLSLETETRLFFSED